MTTVRLLGLRTLQCGCVVGVYREQAPYREVAYVEEKGASCALSAHRRNHTIASPSDLLKRSPSVQTSTPAR